MKRGISPQLTNERKNKQQNQRKKEMRLIDQTIFVQCVHNSNEKTGRDWVSENKQN